MADSSGEVFILKTNDRKTGIPALLKNFDLASYKGQQVALKANFNSADPFPASTHIDTLRAIVKELKAVQTKQVTLAERSGMGNTEQVLEQMGVYDLSRKLGFDAVALDNIDKDGWIKFERGETHWLRGFYFAKVFHDADKIVQTCCLKTHRFGGHFTLSMKNSVGMVAKKVPGGMYDYMWELHGSSFQRQMIAEINNHYNLDFVLMDGIKAFISGGPDTGTLAEPSLLLASRDRVAIDAVGAAILKIHGAQGKIGDEAVFEQDQLKRASQLGFGVKSANEINITSLNDETRIETEKIEQILRA